MLAPLFLASVLAAWPAPLREAAQAEAATSPIAFTMAVETAEEKITVEHDPSAVSANRWLVKYPSGRKLNKSEQDLFNGLKRTRNQDLFCATRLDSIPSAVTLKSESADAFVYAYKPTPGPKTAKQIASAMKHSSAEIRVSKATGRIAGGRIWTDTPFSPAPMVKLNAYDESYECGQGVGGASVTARSRMKLDIAALGKTRLIERDMALSDIRIAR